MPTIKQLPLATSVSDADLLPVSQGGTTRGLTVGGLLSSTQPAIALATGSLLGRVSAGAGGPEQVGIGTGLAMGGGAVAATGADHLAFPASTALGAGDEVVVNSGGAAKRMVATALRALFSAGSGVAIDGSGVISSSGAAVATSGTVGSVKPGTTLVVAGDGTLDARVGSTAGTVAAGNDARIVGAEPLGLGDLRRYGWVGDGRDETAVFAAALAALPGSGGEIVVPYSLSGTTIGAVTVNKSVVIRGEGAGPYGQVLLRPANLAATMFTVTAAFVTFADLMIGPLNPTTSKATAGSYILVQPSAARFRAERLTLVEFNEGVTVAGNVPTVELTNIRGFLYSTGLSQSKALVHLQGGLDVRITGMTANGPGTGTTDIMAGIWVEAVGDAVVSNSDIIAMGTDLLVVPGNGQSVTSLWVVDTFLDTASRGAWLAPTGSGSILRCRLSNVWASSHAYEGIRVEAGVDGLDVDAPHVFLNAGNGIALLGGTNVRVRGGQVAQNGVHGIYVAPGVSDFGVAGVTAGAGSGLLGNTQYPVYIAAGASDRYQVVNTAVHGNGTDTVFDGGTGTHKAVWNNVGDGRGYRAYRDPGTGHLRLVGTEAGTSGFDFATDDGTVRASINASGLTVGGSAAVTVANAATTVPVAAGTGAVGSSTAYARGDHQHPLALATTSAAGAVKVGSGLAVAGDGTLSTTGSTTGATGFVRSSYAASGAIATTDTLSVLTGSASLSMTLAAGTADGQGILVVLLASANATVSGVFDGSSQAIALTASASGTVRDKLKVRWSAADNTWFVE